MHGLGHICEWPWRIAHSTGAPPSVPHPPSLDRRTPIGIPPTLTRHSGFPPLPFPPSFSPVALVPSHPRPDSVVLVSAPSPNTADVSQINAVAAETGMPMIRPMFLQFPDDAESQTATVEDQYMFGPNWLVRAFYYFIFDLLFTPRSTVPP